ncbi:GumC family protein [Mucilaginibacter calamicampi]|uniref:non-specific protein-tyrosine kinase n=1 Tax=Mucilaginibacter calamicampi TaxID=1302352 RepID=A0ABW2YWG0_9SPHI
MSKQKTQTLAAFTLPGSGTEGQTSGMNLLIKKYIYHWPLFVLCTIITLVGAYFYLKTTVSVYPILATLEFKSPTASSASLTVNQNSTEQQLDPIDKPIIVENEIEVMQSKKIIYQVVDELQLWTSYIQKKGLKNVDLYKQSPVTFKFVQQEGITSPTGEKLIIHIKSPKNFAYEDAHGKQTIYNFSSIIKTGIGTWQLIPTSKVSSFLDSTITIRIQDPDQVTDGLQATIKVALENKDAPFVNLTTSDEVPQRGKDVLNSLMNLYVQYAMESKSKLSQRTLKFIGFRLDSLRKELNAIETDIQIYRSAHNITDIREQAQDFRDLGQTNIKNMNEVDIELGVLNNLERYANSSESEGELPAISNTVKDQALNDIYSKLTELQMRREFLVTTVTKDNPILSTVNQQISSLKKQFKGAIQSTKASLLAERNKLQQIENGLKVSLKSVPAQDKEYSSLKRYQESKENIYKFLLEKYEQVNLRYSSSVSDSEVVDDAHAGRVKWPIPIAVYAIALIVGLAIAAGILYLRESMNDLIISRRQIEDETEVPILGELAYQVSNQQIVVSEGRSKFAIGEQFRVLRTNLYHLHSNNGSGRVTLFTSSVSGEGKSFVSSNLAVTLAYASRKTIIMEMDLRKPKISVAFGLPSAHTGISNYLNNETSDVKSLIQPSGIPGLDVLGCGSILPNPSELLENEKLDELINKLKAMYDDIIIDSPPIHLVTDALIIARVADASLYVVRQGYTHKYELEFVNEINEAQRFPKFTIVFNGVKSGLSSYGGYGQGYGYGYGYGYGGYNGYNSYATKEKVTFGKIIKGLVSRF